MASKYLNSFARLIRLILESSRHDYISLKSEIDILNYYLEIQKMRFSDNLNFSFEIDPKLDTDRIKIPPMLAQPFIENSIEHGIQHLDEIGELKIKFVSDDTRLIIQLHDNGIGRVASHNLNKENIITSSSLSTEIINERIDAINKYSKKGISYNIIDLKNDLNQAIGTQVIISIPIDYF
jgi:LytS/YehU family sensor histidine kinase